jgi:hypothetical protein
LFHSTTYLPNGFIQFFCIWTSYFILFFLLEPFTSSFFFVVELTSSNFLYLKTIIFKSTKLFTRGKLIF